MSNGKNYDPLFGDDPILETAGSTLKDFLDEALAPPGQKLIRRPTFGVPLLTPGLERPGIPFLNPFIGPTDALLSELFAGLLSPSEEPSLTARAIETVGQPSPGAVPVDITDPAVDLGDVELTPFEKIIRTMRTVGRAGRVAALSPPPAGPLAPGVGLQRAYMEGILAPPSNEAEAILHMTGAMLAGLGVFGPLGAGGAVTGARSVTRQLGSAALLGRGAPATQEFVGGALVFDPALGAIAGVGEAMGLKELGVDEQSVAKSAALYAGIGLGLGTFFRLGTAANLARSAGRYLGLASEAFEDIAPGVVVGKKQTELIRGRVQFRDLETGKLTKATDEEVVQFRRGSIEKARQQIEQTPQGQAVEEAAVAAPSDAVPPDISTPENLVTMNRYAAMYYDRAVGRVRSLGPEGATLEMNELRRMRFDVDLPDHVRLSAGARLRAMEAASGEATGELPGVLPLNIERAAVEIVRRGLPLKGEAEILRQANVIAEIDKRPALANRIRQLVAEWRSGGGLSRAEHGEVLKRLNKTSRLRSRGLTVGSKGIYEGRVVKLLDNPRYGLARARYLDGPEEPFHVDIENLLPFPESGKLASLKSGQIVSVGAVDEAKGQFLATEISNVSGGKQPEGKWVPLSEIDEVASSPSGFRTLEARQRALVNELQVGDVEPIPPTSAVTPEGEAITVVGIGKEAAEIVTRTGRQKTIPREKLRRSSATPPAVDEREIVDFAPGTLPEEGNKILYFAVPKDQAQALEDAVRVGDFSLLPTDAKGRPMGHVLPPVDYLGDQVVYAVEAPASLLPMKGYSSLGKKALGALSGKIRVERHFSPADLPAEALKAARFFRVPEGLARSAARSPAILAQMTKEEQTAYFRNLLAFNENVPSEVAQPMAKAREARIEIAAAIEQLDAEGVHRGASKLAEAHIETIEKIAKVQREEAAPDLDAIVESAKAEDTQTPMREQFDVEGLTPETEPYFFEKLEELPATLQGEPDGVSMMALSPEGQRVFIFKREQAALIGDQPGTIPAWELQIVNPERRTLSEAGITLDSPKSVGEYLVSNGYVPTLYKAFRAEYVHPRNQSLVGTIQTIGATGRTRATIQERITPSIRERAIGETTPAEAVLAELGEEHIEVASGQSMFKTVASKESIPYEEAEEWFFKKGLLRRTPREALSIVSRWKKMPDLATATKEQLLTAEDELTKLMTDVVNVQRRLPPAIEDYAYRFAEVFKRVTGKVPFTRELRRAISREDVVADIGPQGIPSVLDDIEGLTVKRSLSESPVWEEVRSEIQVRVGKTYQDNARAAEELAKILRGRPTEGFAQLAATRQGLVDELSAISSTLSKSTELGDITRAQARLNQIVKATRALEKLRVGIKPAPVELRYLPATEEVGRALSVVTGEGAGLGRPGAATRVIAPYQPRNYMFHYGSVLGAKAEEALPAARVAKKISDAQSKQTLWTDTYIKSQGVSPSPSQFSPENIATARYTPTGQVVGIIDGELSNILSSDVRVRFPGTGEEMTVSKDLLRPGRFKSQDTHDYALAEWIADGRYAAFYKGEPPMGYGSVERQLGLLGSNDRNVIGSALFQRVEELAGDLKVRGDVVDAPVEVMDELFETYRRAQWLSEVETERPVQPQIIETGEGRLVTERLKGTGERTTETLAEAASEQAIRALRQREPPKVRVTSMADDVLAAIRAVDPKLEKPFKWAAYQRTKQALGDHPFAELQAKAFAGMLSKDQEGTLRKWAQKLGISQKAPLAKIVVELQERRLIDPAAARYAVQLRKDAGFIKWFSGANAPAGRVILKTPRVNDLGIGGEYFLPGWKVARKHPLARLVDDLIYRAQDIELRFVSQRYRVFLSDLNTHGIKFNDRKAIRELRLGGYKTWEAVEKAGKAPADPEKAAAFQYAWNAYENLFEEGLEQIKRHFLRRRVQPLPYKKDDPQHREWIQELGMDPDDVADTFMFLPKTPDLVLRKDFLDIVGEIPSGWTEDEIEVFMTLQRRFDKTSDWLGSILPGVTPERYNQFAEVFDFWKRYGRENYWPLVHEGNLAAVVERGGKREIVAWAQNRVDMYDAIKQLRKDGRLAQGEDVILEERAQIVDDILVRALPEGEWRQAARTMAEHNEGDARALLISVDRPQEFVRAPGQVHAKPRERGLRPVFDDPDREVGVFLGRIARMDYRWRVMEAFRLLKDEGLDRALSDGYGTPRLHGRDGMVNLKKYMYDRMSRALGEQTSWERRADQLWMFLNWMRNAPRLQIEAWKRGASIEKIWNPYTYYQKYAARARATDLLKFQSFYRLGLSFGSALANWTQFTANTIPKLIDNEFGVGQATKMWWPSQRDGFKIWRAWLNGAKPEGELGIIYDIVDQAGIELMPMKQLAGAGASFADAFGGPPIYREKAGEFINQWLYYHLMYFFNGAEKVNRYGTAVAAVRKYGLQRNKTVGQLTEIERGEAVAAARDLVRETQFLYDELSMPQALAQFGPVGRILFQFKPFMFNMLSFEKDLVANAFLKGDAASIGQLGTHAAALVALGGATGLLHNPVISALGSLVKATTGKEVLDVGGVSVPITPTGAEALQRRRRREVATPEENFTETMHYRADDFLLYGLPGLAHMSLGQRVGVSGQELLMSLDAPGLLGPHASVYIDLAKAWNTYRQQRGMLPGAAGGLAGAVATSFLPAGVRNVPFAKAAGGIIGGQIASLASNNPFGDFLANSPEGKKLASRGLPTLYRNALRTFELFTDGAIRDIDGKPMHVPVDNRAEEMFFLAAGLPSIRREEYSAAISFLTAGASGIEATRQNFVNRIARAWADNRFEDAYEATYQATELGIDIPEASIQRELDAISQERLATIRKRLPISARYREP